MIFKATILMVGGYGRIAVASYCCMLGTSIV